MSTAKKKLTSCAPKTAVAYARYSSASQRDVSIEQQLKDIRAYAEREGYTIIHEYADHAKSGFKNAERREEFQAMLRAAASGTFDTVIAWKVDRFGRNRRESAVYKGQLADNGVSVVYAMEPIPDGAAGVLTEGMLEALAEWYSRTIGENTIRGLMDNATKGLYNGHAAYGYRKSEDNHFVINEAEAAIVRRIFTLYSEGNSFAEISRILNDEGIKTKYGNQFQKATLLYILRNENYIGVYHYADVKIPDAMPAIIDMDLWESCQAMRAKTFRNHGKNPEPYYLSGKCFCGCCNAKMYGNYASKKGKRHTYYVCSKKKTKECTSMYRRTATIEGPVFDFLFNQVIRGERRDEFINTVADALTSRAEISPLQQLQTEYQEVSRRIDNINLAISEGIWTKSTGAMLTNLAARQEELQKKITYHQMTDNKAVSKERIQFMFHEVANGDITDREYRQTIAKTLINSVTVYDNWLLLSVNAAENVDTIPPEALPPLENITDISSLGNVQSGPLDLTFPTPYPIIVFKIAI